MSEEFERRFLLDRLPAADATAHTVIRQVYWQLGNGWCVRLRREGSGGEPSRDTVALKGPRTGPRRPEFEILVNPVPGLTALTEAQVTSLFQAGRDHRIVKDRTSFLLDGQAWDIDEFHWENEGLIIAELEMRNLAELERVPVPRWCVREITGENQYDNENLAFHPYRKWT